MVLQTRTIEQITQDFSISIETLASVVSLN